MTDAPDYTIPVRASSAVCIMWQSKFDRPQCRKHINESSPSLKPQTSFYPPQKKSCIPPSRVEAFTRPRAAIVMRYAALYRRIQSRGTNS